MQSEIDAGLKWCEPCDQWGRHEFCGHCGKRYLGRELEWRTCLNKSCRAAVTTDWCPICGTQVSCEKLREFERGEIDLAAESARAMAQLERIYKVRPDLAPGQAQPRQASLSAAVMEVFGR